jgi:serine/threonine-protein kinase
LTHLVGQQLGRYLVQEEIGRGGMARVFRALDTSLQRTVALKVLAPQLAVDPEFSRRFEREAVTAANLRHPNIVTIFDVGEHNGLRYIAMEYVRGRSLHTIIEERGALGLSYAIGIVAPVAAALDYAHSQGSVHRDIKPHNIMIDTDGRVLLTDFGIAQAPEGTGERLTRTGIFMGTPEYISPEQASAQRVDGRSDLYSLGIATYEIITGQVPFSGATPQLIVAHAQNTPPPPSSVDPAQPHELDVVMARILAKRPDQRFASGANFVEALRIVARKHTIATATAAQLAALVQPRDSSAGQDTLSLGRGQTPRAAAPVPPAPKMAPRPAPARPATPRVPTSPPPDAETVVRPPARVPTGPTPLPPRASERRVPWAIAGPLLGGALVLAFLFLLSRIGGATTSPNASPQPTRVVASPIPTQVTPSFTPPPTPTLPPTATVAEPTVPPAPTRPPPTRAPVNEPFPASTPEPPPPEPPTAEPPPPELPTDTPEPPTVEPPTEELPTPVPITVEPPTVEPPTVEPPTAEVPVETTTTGSIFSPTPTVEPPTVEPPTVELPTAAPLPEPATAEPPPVAPATAEPPTVEPAATP